MESNSTTEELLKDPTRASSPGDTGGDKGRDLSAATVGRMLGLATSVELKVLENKLDLMSTKLVTHQLKLDKLVGALTTAPTTSDLERIDLQIAQLKVYMNEVLEQAVAGIKQELQSLSKKPE
jgi:hypothetical protein